LTINIQPARNEFTSNAGQTIFSYTFKIFSITDLNVYITPAGQDANDSTDLTTAYTVTGVDDEDGGTITLTVGANLNDLVTIVSNVPSSRTIDYQNNGDFRPDVVNSDFDRVVSIAKKVEDLTNRALLIQQSQQGPKPLTLPGPVAGKVVAWKSDLSGMENKNISDLGSLIASANITYAFETLNDAVISSDPAIAFAGALFFIEERTAGNGGGAVWGFVLATSVTPNTFNIVISTGISTLALVLIDTGTIIVKQFGGVGGGVTSNVAVFDFIDSNFTNALVDLSDDVFRVDRSYTNNRYVNGQLVYEKSTTISTVVDDYDYIEPMLQAPLAEPTVNIKRDLHDSTSTELYELTESDGLDSIAFDEINSFIYAIFDDTPNVTAFVTRYSSDDVLSIVAVQKAKSLSSDLVGHQGLSVEHQDDGTVKLWTSMQTSGGNPNGFKQVMRFDFVDAALPANVQIYTLFGDEFAFATNNTMPEVALGGRYLVAVGRKSSRDFFVRVWSLELLADGGAGDYSDSFLYEWQIDRDILADDEINEFTPVQSIASDGSHVYILSGNAKLSNKRIHQYTLNGKRVATNDKLEIGRANADAIGTFYEPEGLTFYRDRSSGMPTMAVLMLASGKRNFVYKSDVQPYLDASTWTPTLTAVSGDIQSLGAFTCQYMRMGDIVTGSGRVNVDVGTLSAIVFRMSPPVPIVGTSLTQAQGNFSDGEDQHGRIQLDTVNNELEFTYTATDSTTQPMSFTFTCRIFN
jgi:hypothetical protein